VVDADALHFDLDSAAAGDHPVVVCEAADLDHVASVGDDIPAVVGVELGYVEPEVSAAMGQQREVREEGERFDAF